MSTAPRFCPECGQNALAQHGKMHQCERCGFTFYVNVAAAVAAIIEHNGAVLVATRKHPPQAGAPDLPGGFVDPYETAEEALVRELAEELGAQLTHLQYLCTQHNRYPYKQIEYHTLDLFFVCTVANPESLHAHDDVSGFRWIARKDLRPEDFPFESMQKGIEFYLHHSKK